MSEPALLSAHRLARHFAVRDGLRHHASAMVRAVDGVEFELDARETLALVGESGCGKTTVGRLVLRLLAPSAGEVRFRGQDINALRGAALKAFRRRAQIVFQDPYGSLNPRLTVAQIVGEAVRVHGIARGLALNTYVARLLDTVGLAAAHAGRYPHEFSGGQRQRIGIARALALKPELIVCDEAVSALDVSIQAQILNLLRDLKDEFGLAYLFISHDLNVVRFLADRVAVMYLGRIVEIGGADELFSAPSHPYTRALLLANPEPDPAVAWTPAPLPGEPPSPLDPPLGCPFHPRCTLADERCAREMPALGDHAERQVACHHLD